MNNTIVELTTKDAERFMQFMRHYDKFAVLLESGFFEQKKATIAVNIDHNGDIKSIQRADFLFSAMHDKIS